MNEITRFGKIILAVLAVTFIISVVIGLPWWFFMAPLYVPIIFFSLVYCLYIITGVLEWVFKDTE